MNQVTLLGRLTKDPEVREKFTSFSIAVDRRFKRDGEPTADFFNCVAFGKTADFVAKYFFKGKMIALTGRIENDSYTNKEGRKINTTSVKVESVEFAGPREERAPEPMPDDGFIAVPEGVQEELPFMV